ncbi:hypothetical protein BKA70DRAFT_1437815 [Coprinopsis sp. MPI-PUGE-AT-0042]|nr:hypothetical protein BKA70DRAFT_1437815 [Coprinopsis sp. MPI-PUGE-AT-0042]
MDMIDEGPTASPKEETFTKINQTINHLKPHEVNAPVGSTPHNHAAQGKEPRFLQANNCGIQLAPLSQTSGITSLPADPGSLTRASQQGKRCEVFRGLKSGTWPAPNGPASRMPHGEGETRHLPSLPLQSSPPLTRTPQRLIFDPKATKSRLLVPIEKPLRLAATRKEMTNIYPSPESAFTPPPRTQRTIRFNDETLTGCDSENQQAVGAKEVAASKELGTPRNPAFQRDSFPKSEQSVIQTKGDDDRVAASLQVCAVSDDPASSGLTRQSILPAVHSLRSSPSNDLTATLFALLVHSDDSAMTRSLLILVISMDFLYKWSQVVSAFLTVVVGTNGGLATRLRYEKEPYAYSSQSLALSTSQRKVL